MSDTPSAELTSQGCRRFKPYPVYKDSGVEWLGKIPAHWEVKKLAWLTKCLDGRRVPLNAEERGRMQGDHPYWGANSIVDYVDDWLFDDELVLLGEDGAPFFDRTKPVAFHVSGKIWVNNHAHVLRPRSSIETAFLAHALNCVDYRAFIDGTTRDKLTQSDMNAIPIQCPPPYPEQHTIAAFLDRETARIDALVTKKEQLIELLQEKRTALITRAVTRGLDPNIRMKDSGVKWLGQIPAHWEVKPFTKYVVEKADYRGKTPEKVASGVFLVTARNVRMGLIDYECSQEFIAEEDYDEIMRRGLPRRGDILFTTEAPLGNVALVDREDIALAQRIIRFRMNIKHFESRFTLFAMMSGYFQAQLFSLSTGSTAEGLKATKLPMLRLVAPSPAEQHAIVEFIDQETARIDTLLAKVRDAIERLKELRTALISAAVTGKIDVREEVT